MKLSKTNYLIFRDCAHNAWVKIHRPAVYKAKPLSVFDQALVDTGNKIDLLARNLFPYGTLINQGDAARTAELVSQRAAVLYQPVFETDCYTTACDILVWNGTTGSYDLYEVKASTNGGDKNCKDDLYAHDLAFQAQVLRQNGVPLGKLHIVRLNCDYVSSGLVDLPQLFTQENFNERVALISETVRAEMDAAHHLLQLDSAPLPPCACIYKGRSSHCTTFAYTNPAVPDYSVHDLARIGSSKTKLAALIGAGVFAIANIPDDFELTEKQRQQADAETRKQAFIDKEAVASFLGQMQFPIAFLDYETYPCALPRFAGYRPFDQIPFQFSLHVVDAAGDTRHHEFLFTEPGCPDAAFLAALKAALPSTGTIVVWNQTFEKGINAKLAGRQPGDKPFLDNLNDRVVDLMDVFTEQMVVHPAFKGKTSIKYILPALAPHLSYRDLAIQEGATASALWNRIATGELDQAESNRQRENLLKYCGLDSLAMVEIWRALHAAIANTQTLGSRIEANSRR